MGTSEQKTNWKTVSRSQFPWEQEALDFIYGRFPSQDNYRAWANFEFFADDGSINEVDLLVASPQGIFLIEIKSHPGQLSASTLEWTWERDGHKKTVENPVILANRKCKRLKSLLGRQKAFLKEGVPYIEPLVFLSAEDLTVNFSGNTNYGVCLRDSDTVSGIMGAICRRECPGMKQFDGQVVNRPRIRAVALAMDQAGIRPTQKSRRVGDFILEDLIFDSPLGFYQDWNAHHSSVESTRRVARLYMVARQATAPDRDIIQKAAFKEFQLSERLDHPGIIKTDPPTECEYGPVLFLRWPQKAKRLDHFLSEEGDSLPVHQRIELLRQIGEIISYAHGQRVVHRSLSPQSILVYRDAAGQPLVKICNWHTGSRLMGTNNSSRITMPSVTLHAEQLIEDASQVYIAPEALSGSADGGVELDVFSLGALAYLLFTGKPPASSVTELQQKLKNSLSGGLNINDVMDGAVDSLVDLIRRTVKQGSPRDFQVEIL